MRAFIMAAGEGTRMWPLTENRPKPLLPVGNVSLIERILNSLISSGISKISILVGREGRVLVERIGYSYRGVSLDYRYQEERRGTGDAALYASGYSEERFMFINGDMIFDGSILRDMKDRENAVLGVFMKDAERYGILEGDDRLIRINEKENGARNRWVNGGVYVFHRDIFDAIRKCDLSPRGELELTDAINLFAKNHEIDIVKTRSYWKDVGTPWDLLDANREFLGSIEGKIDGTVEENVMLRGDVIIGKGSIIKSGTYIEGPVIIGENCEIGPNSYIRPYSSIGDGCRIGNSSEVKASVIMNGAKIPHFNYVGDSVIGERCNLGAGTKIANLRLDEKNIKVNLKGEYVDTGRKKLGVIMGDDVHTGINASIFPGTIIGSNARIGPGAHVSGNILSQSVIM